MNASLVIYVYYGTVQDCGVVELQQSQSVFMH